MALAIGGTSSGGGVRAVTSRIRSSFADGLSGVIRGQGGGGLTRATIAGLSARQGAGVRSNLRNSIDIRA